MSIRRLWLNSYYLFSIIVCYFCSVHVHSEQQQQQKLDNQFQNNYFVKAAERMMTMGFSQEIVTMALDAHKLRKSTEEEFNHINQYSHDNRHKFKNSQLQDKDNNDIITPAMRIQQSGNEVLIIDDALSFRMLDTLKTRIASLPQNVAGTTSFFVPFDSPPRSALEMLLLEKIAPLVVGDMNEARKNGFIGLEWWIQNRESQKPKEYHLDTAITWCRDNGWAAEDLKKCPYYPTVGTVIYLTNDGGPTVVFNQTMREKGIYPPLPSEIATIFPKNNRMMLFKGDRLHGVLHAPEGVQGVGIRNTLLVNYWRDKTAGESHTPILPRENEFIEAMRWIMKADECHNNNNDDDDDDDDDINGNNRIGNNLINGCRSHKPIIRSLNKVKVERDFRFDILSWQKQVLPIEYQYMISLEKVKAKEREKECQTMNTCSSSQQLQLSVETNDLLMDLISPPAILFQLPISSLTNAFSFLFDKNELDKLRESSTDTLHQIDLIGNWEYWNITNESFNVLAVIDSKVFSFPVTFV